MNISIISDLHAFSDLNYSNNGHGLLSSFLKNSKVIESDVVIFLGDVFDLLVGNYEQYKQTYIEFFKFLEDNRSKRIMFFEGNHDFLCDKLFEQYQNVEYYKAGVVIEYDQKKIYLSHGDDKELSKFEYMLTKKALNNSFTKLMSNKVFDYKIVNAIGSYLSKKSREHNTYKYQGHKHSDELKKRYINFSEAKFSLGIDIVVLGHNHIEEIYSSNSKKYLNNGFSQNTGLFTYIENGNAMLFSIL